MALAASQSKKKTKVTPKSEVKPGFKGDFKPITFGCVKTPGECHPLFFDSSRTTFAPVSKPGFDKKAFVTAVSSKGGEADFASRLGWLTARLPPLFFLDDMRAREDSIMVLVYPREEVTRKMGSGDRAISFKLRTFQMQESASLASLKAQFGEPTEVEPWKGYDDFKIKGPMHWWGDVGICADEGGSVSHLAIRQEFRKPKGPTGPPDTDQKASWRKEPAVFVRHVQAIVDQEKISPELAVPRFLEEELLAGRSTEIEWTGKALVMLGSVTISLEGWEVVHDGHPTRLRSIGLSVDSKEDAMKWGKLVENRKDTPQVVFKTILLPWGTVHPTCEGGNQPVLLGLVAGRAGGLNGMIDIVACGVKGKHSHMSFATMGAVLVHEIGGASEPSVPKAASERLNSLFQGGMGGLNLNPKK